jgi:hypothetical protein
MMCYIILTTFIGVRSNGVVEGEDFERSNLDFKAFTSICFRAMTTIIAMMTMGHPSHGQ